jgi:hypothetical protein
MNSLQYISPIQSKSRRKYYGDNALKAYKGDIKSYNDSRNDSKYTYEVINDFLKVNNVNTDGINLINKRMTKVNKEKELERRKESEERCREERSSSVERSREERSRSEERERLLLNPTHA